MSNKYEVTLFERIVAVLSYFTVGLLGFIYYIVSILTRKRLSYFLRYNILQSVFISFLFFTISMVLGFVCNILLLVPLIKVIVSWIILFFNRPMFGSYSIVQTLCISIIFYSILYSIRGKYPRIYWVSRVIENIIK